MRLNGQKRFVSELSGRQYWVFPSVYRRPGSAPAGLKFWSATPRFGRTHAARGSTVCLNQRVCTDGQTDASPQILSYVRHPSFLL